MDRSNGLSLQQLSTYLANWGSLGGHRPYRQNLQAGALIKKREKGEEKNCAARSAV
jgi:hypothetical protein